MASLVPQAFIDELLARTDIVELIDKRVPLKRTGSNHKACCPFHQEKTPSFTVNANKQFYYCFGCGAAGNAVGFLMDYDNYTFPEAIEYLAQAQGMEIPKEENEKARSEQQTYQPLLKELENAQLFFAEQLRKHKAGKLAISYLKSRGLDGKTARDFGIGFAPPGWNNLLQYKPGDTRQDLLKKAGMLIENENGKVYDRFRNRITFPIKDSRGRVIGFGGRIIEPTDNPKYLNSPETVVFKKGQELYGLFEAKAHQRRLQQLLVVEGYMDVISLAQMGIHYAVATLGTAIGSAHLSSLFKYTKRVCFCFDGDAAGRKAAQKALEVSLPQMSEDKDICFLFLPEGQDPDSLVREKGQQYFEQLIQNAKPLSEYLFDCASNNRKLDTVDARARFSKMGKALIKTMPEGDFKTLMLKELDTRSGLKNDELTHEPPPPIAQQQKESFADIEVTQLEPANRFTPNIHHKKENKPAAIESKYQKLPPVHNACLLLIHNPWLIQSLDEKDIPPAQPGEITILKEIIDTLKHNPSLKTGNLYGRWMQSDHKDFIRSLLASEKLCPPSGVEAEFIDTIKSIKRHNDKQRIKQEIELLKNIGFSALTDTQKQKLRQLLIEESKK